MSEYQYYEFQAIDRPLSDADRRALRDLSTRARITATSFSNSYEWGDFKGDPAKLVERWFDLHLYLANWGARRLIIKLPARLVERDRIDAIVEHVDCVRIEAVEASLIVEIAREELELDGWDDGSGWLAALTPLRAEVLAGDLRLFYLLWLAAVEEDVFEADALEPMSGLGPMTGALEAFANFFGIDPDLVQAAAERPAAAERGEIPSDAARRMIPALADRVKTGLLLRVLDNDPHVAAELRAMVRHAANPEHASSATAPRTVGELQLRAGAIRFAREREADNAAAEARRRQTEAAEKGRQARFETVRRRGESVWQEIETEIERRNSAGYDKATTLLADLQALAAKQDTIEEFRRRLHAIAERHVRKQRFIERLAAIG